MEKVDGGFQFLDETRLGSGYRGLPGYSNIYVERVHRRREELGNNFHGHSREITIQEVGSACLNQNLPDLYGCYGDCLGEFLKLTGVPNYIPSNLGPNAMSQESVEAAYRRKLASNPDGEMDFITLEISHPLLSKRWLLVRGVNDLTATLETGEVVTFEGTPMEAKNAANNNDMDQTASFSLPDVLNILDEEMDRILTTIRNYLNSSSGVM